MQGVHRIGTKPEGDVEGREGGREKRIKSVHW